jgi:hypothetical protein
MELRNHYRLVKFSPVPECVEPVNVAVLLVDRSPRIVTDFKFQKLGCVAPFFNKSVLEFWIKELSEELSGLNATDGERVSNIITSRTSQIKLGAPNFVSRDFTKAIEDRLINVYLKRQDSLPKISEEHIQYVDTLIDDAIDRSSLVFGEVLKRAKPTRFLSSRSLALLPTSTVKFSRVINSPKSLILVDGLNLAVTNRAQLRQRAAEIDFGFYAFSGIKGEVEEIEGKELTRASFVFNAPAFPDAETQHVIRLLTQDSDIKIDASDRDALLGFNTLVKERSRFL